MVYEIIGWFGAGLVLSAYFLVSTGKLSPNSKKYQLINMFGAIGIIINALYHNAIPSVGLNVVWLLIAVFALLKIIKK